jgi:hypothetical protein
MYNENYLMKSKSSKQKKIKNRIRRKSLKRKKKTRHAQNGGELQIFQLYFFTEHEINEPTKTQLMNMLIKLYGRRNISYPNYVDNVFHNMCKSEITQHLLDKKRDKYINKTHILGFNLFNNTPFPKKLKGDMDDDKLTREENTIQTALERTGLPFRLVDTPPGLWNDELAIIAFEDF